MVKIKNNSWFWINIVLVFQIIVAVVSIVVIFKHEITFEALEKQYTLALTPSPIPTPMLTPSEKILYTFHIHITPRQDRPKSISIQVEPSNDGKTFTVTNGELIRLLRSNTVSIRRILVMQSQHVLEYPDEPSSSLKTEIRKYQAVNAGDATIIITEGPPLY
jgi:hypothetical protein